MPTVLRIVTRLNRGGPLRQLAALVPGLAARGFSGPVAFGQVGRGEGDGRGLLSGADLHPLPALRPGIEPAADLRAFGDLLALARASRPNLIHTHMGKAGALGRLVARRLGIPAVHTLHGHHFDAPGRRGRLAVLAERALGRLTQRVIVLSERQRRDVVEVHRVLPASKVRVVGPGMDMQAYRRTALEAPYDAGPQAHAAAAWLAGGLPTFVWCGRFVPVKDPLLLIDALRHARLPWRVIMVGGGPLHGRARRVVRRRGLGERVAFAGMARQSGPWLRGARALVMTSRSEGTPLAVLEAFALGRPSVVPTVGGIPDLLGHDVEGLWVPPGDARGLAAALDRLALDDALVARLGAGAAAAAERYAAERLVERTAALYAETLAGGA